MDRPLKRLSDRPVYDFRTGSFGYVEVPNYLTQEERTRIRNDKSVMYVQTETGRVPVHFSYTIDGTYGKAKVYADNSTYVLYLRSYDTIVCAIRLAYSRERDEPYRCFIRYWGDWSRTTQNHINAFLAMYGYAQINKKQWNEFPLYTWTEV